MSDLVDVRNGSFCKRIDEIIADGERHVFDCEVRIAHFICSFDIFLIFILLIRFFSGTILSRSILLFLQFFFLYLITCFIVFCCCWCISSVVVYSTFYYSHNFRFFDVNSTFSTVFFCKFVSCIFPLCSILLNLTKRPHFSCSLIRSL